MGISYSCGWTGMCTEVAQRGLQPLGLHICRSPQGQQGSALSEIGWLSPVCDICKTLRESTLYMWCGSQWLWCPGQQRVATPAFSGTSEVTRRAQHSKVFLFHGGLSNFLTEHNEHNDGRVQSIAGKAAERDGSNFPQSSLL